MNKNSAGRVNPATPAETAAAVGHMAEAGGVNTHDDKKSDVVTAGKAAAAAGMHATAQLDGTTREGPKKADFDDAAAGERHTEAPNKHLSPAVTQQRIAGEEVHRMQGFPTSAYTGDPTHPQSQNMPAWGGGFGGGMAAPMYGNMGGLGYNMGGLGYNNGIGYQMNNNAGVLGAHMDVKDSKAGGDKVRVIEDVKQHVPTYGATAIPPLYENEVQHTSVKATPTKTMAMPDGTFEQIATGPPEAMNTRVHTLQRNYKPYQQAIADHMQMTGVVDENLQPLQKVKTSMRPVVDAPNMPMTPIQPHVHVIQELDTKYIPAVLDVPSNAGGSVDSPTHNHGVPLPKGPTVAIHGAGVPEFGRLDNLHPELPALGQMVTIRAPVAGDTPKMEYAAGLTPMPYPAGPVMGFPDAKLLPIKSEPYPWDHKMALDKIEHNVAVPGGASLSPAAQLAYGESMKLASKYGKYLNAEMEHDMIPDTGGNAHNPITRLIHNVQKNRIVCTNDTDCSGNGRCNPDGTCLCNSDWLGAYCSDMDIIKLNRRCFKHPSCQHCIRDQTCGWAANLRRCMFGMVDGPEANVFDKNITQWDFQFCSGEPCRSYLTCDTCTADPLCVYCHQPIPLQTNVKTLPTGACIEGDSRGPLYHCPNDMSVWTYREQGKCPSMSVHRMRGSTVNKGDEYIEGAVHYDTVYGPMDVPQKTVHPDNEVEDESKEKADDKKEADEVSDKPAKPAAKAGGKKAAPGAAAAGGNSTDANATDAGNGTATNKPESEESLDAPKEDSDHIEPAGADAAAADEEKKKDEDAKDEAEKPADDKAAEEAEKKEA